MNWDLEALKTRLENLKKKIDAEHGNESEKQQ